MPTTPRVLAMAAAVAVVAIAVAVVGIPGRATYGNQVSGDEPHYLVTAISLGEDADLDVADELDEERYRPFHEQRLRPQAARQPDGRMLVPHDPLLPALLALPMRTGGWVAAKATLAVIAGLLAALLIWTAVRRFAVRPGTAAIVVGLLAASAPFAPYGHQVYPELPAALAVTAATSALLGARRWTTTVVVLAAVIALPWLAVKYAPVAAVLALVLLIALRRDGRPRDVVACVAVLAIAAVGYAVAHLAWYGGLTSYAAGAFFQEHGGQLTVVGIRPAYLARSRRLLGLFTDRGFGLAAWQPLWLATIPAVAGALRRRSWPDVVLAAPLATGWLVATFVALTMQGWWFPGRQVVVVLPLAALLIARWADRAARRVAVAVAAGALGVWSYAWLAVQAARGELTWIVDFASTVDPWYRLWRLALPDELHLGPGTWVRHVVWLLVAAGLAWLGWRRYEVGDSEAAGDASVAEPEPVPLTDPL